MEFHRFKLICEANDSALKAALALSEKNKEKILDPTEEAPFDHSQTPPLIYNEETFHINQLGRDCEQNKPLEVGDSEETIEKATLEETSNWCDHCQSNLDSSLEVHVKDYHPQAGSNYCHLCPRGSSSVYATAKQLRAHLKYHA